MTEPADALHMALVLDDVLDSLDVREDYTRVRDPDSDNDAAIALPNWVPVLMTTAQVRAATDALSTLNSRLDAAEEGAARCKAEVAAALADYQRTTGSWLTPLHEQARKDRDATLAADDRRQADADKARADQLLAERDDQAGPRDYARVPAPRASVPAQYRNKYGPQTWRLHKVGCAAIDDSLEENPDTAYAWVSARLRAGAALDLYVGGALACGRCKVVDALAADTHLPRTSRDMATAELARREATPAPISTKTLEEMVRGIGRGHLDASRHIIHVLHGTVTDAQGREHRRVAVRNLSTRDLDPMDPEFTGTLIKMLAGKGVHAEPEQAYGKPGEYTGYVLARRMSKTEQLAYRQRRTGA